ncbi:MAG: shikimate kinase [Bacillota bacterium]|nr:shikimate kinase [Bacillota bacterium]
MKNIVLIGMPSSGKTTIGKLLAKKHEMAFVDTDQLIREQENRELSEIVNTQGLDAFLRIQENLVTGLELDNSIISTGGSVVYGEYSMSHLKTLGKIIYLEVEFEELERRITTKRRFARNREQSFHDLYLERVPLYRKYADAIINCSGKTADDIAMEIASGL